MRRTDFERSKRRSKLRCKVQKFTIRDRGTGVALEASAPPLFVPGEKVPFLGNESALFSWNRSTVLAKRKCPFWSVPLHFRGASAASVHNVQTSL